MGTFVPNEMIVTSVNQTVYKTLLVKEMGLNTLVSQNQIPIIDLAAAGIVLIKKI